LRLLHASEEGRRVQVMAFDWNDLKLKGARFVSLRTDPRPKVHMVKRRDEKIVVPSREERLEIIGGPKPPKMGGVTPKTVDLPEVDDLLEKMKQVTPKTKKDLLSVPLPGTIDFGELWTKEDHSHCHVNCKCPPCLGGFCSRCTVEALRNEPQDVVRAAVTQYRGTVFQ
jgi:hypothetical protein